MGKFIPVDPDRLAELVKAAGERDAFAQEVARLEAELTNLKSTADRFEVENSILIREINRLLVEVDSLMINPTSRLLRAEREENDRLKAEVEDWRNSNRVKAVRIEAQILDRLVELKKENSRLLDAGDALAYAARHQMAYETELEGWRAAKSPTPSNNDNPTPRPL